MHGGTRRPPLIARKTPLGGPEGSPALVTAFPLTVPTVTGTRALWPQTQGHLGTTEKGRGIHLGDSGPHVLEHRDQDRHCPAAASSIHKPQKLGRSTHTLQPLWPSLRPTAEPAPASHLPLLLLRRGSGRSSPERAAHVSLKSSEAPTRPPQEGSAPGWVPVLATRHTAPGVEG